MPRCRPNPTEYFTLSGFKIRRDRRFLTKENGFLRLENYEMYDQDHFFARLRVDMAMKLFELRD